MQKHSMTNFEIRSWLLCSALALGAALSAHAQPAKSPCDVLAASNTADAIDPISPPASNSEAAAFDRADTNQDGKLDTKEAEHFPAIAPHFRLLDIDHDQFLSRDELKRGAAEKV